MGTPGQRAVRDRATQMSVLLAILVLVQVCLAGVELATGKLTGSWTATTRLLLLGFGLLPTTLILVYRLSVSHQRLTMELATHDESFTAMLSGIDQWTWSIDREGLFIYSNSGVKDLLGYDPDELLGRDSVTFLVGRISRAGMARRLDDYREARQGWTGLALDLRHKDGSIRHVEGHGIPILDADGELIGWSGSMKDKTDDVEASLDLGRRTQEVISVVEGEALDILFQPIVDLRNGEVVGAEALSRFRTQPYRPPNVWFAAAHAVDLGAELELLAVRKALSRMDELPPNTFLAINVSPGLLPHAALEGHLASHDLRRIVIEVTEHEYLDEDQYARIKEAMAELKSFGARVAVDDAGAGFSSLRHVLELDPDIVKLDVSITASIERDPARRALASSLAHFARATGIEVVAEGIETAGDARTILAAGINFGQGYALAPPAVLPLPTRLMTHLDGQPIPV